MLTANDNNYLCMVSIYGIDYHFIKFVNVVFYKQSAGDFCLQFSLVVQILQYE